MQKLYHTIYVQEADIVIKKKGKALQVVYPDMSQAHVPLEMTEAIVIFSNAVVEPDACQLCAENRINIWFLNRNANVRYRISGRINGNVIVRKNQSILSESNERMPVVKAMIQAKISNSRSVIDKFSRNHPERAKKELKEIRDTLKKCELKIQNADSESEIRSIEAYASKCYFQGFSHMILRNEGTFQFTNRNRRPPKDCINALFSFTYTLLMIECIGALESAGIDPYIGFLHADRSGRASMALDVMEEFRPLLADRFVLRLVNLAMVNAEMFDHNKGGVYLNGKGKTVVLKEWWHMKQEKVYLSELNENVEKGLFPHVQAQKLVRFIKGETKEYLPIQEN